MTGRTNQSSFTARRCSTSASSHVAFVRRSLDVSAFLVVWAACLFTACARKPTATPRTPGTELPPPRYAAAAPVSVSTPARGTEAGVPQVVEAPQSPSIIGEAREPGEQVPVESASAPEPLPFQMMSYGSQPLRSTAVARRFGNLSPGACAKELRKLNGTFKRVGAHKGIATPTRVVGLVEGVKFRVPGEKSKFGILDCRLALTLVEFARFLHQREVAEVVVDNFYRLNARLPSARSKRSQHAYGLAIDLRSFRMTDGRVWDVETDWGASTDTEACGPQATLVNPTENTVGLRSLVCELFAEQIFSHHLTPSHDAAHRNHLHLDIKRDAKSAVIK